MGRAKKPSYDSRTKIQILHYQWESLRANPEYVREYRQFRRIWEKPQIEYARFWYRLERFFQKKYGIPPMNPDIALPARCPDPTKKRFTEHDQAQYTLWIFLVDRGKAAYCFSPGIEDVMRDVGKHYSPPKVISRHISDAELKDKVSIFIAVNLNEPMPRILADVRNIVEPLQERKRRLVGSKSDRIRLGEYKLYYKAYRLQQNGLSSTATARRLYPNDYERDPYYARRKVKRDCERWKTIWHPLRTSALNTIPIFSPELHAPGILSAQQYFELSKARHEEEKRRKLTDPY